MRAVAYKVSRPIDDREALVDVDLPRPEPRERDLLVEVKAISVNPVDTKVRVRAQPPEGEWKVLGWDVAGVVAGVGPEARRFKVGDEVYYSGEFTRPGANAEFHVVDERIVGTKPRTLDWAQAAALPLTAITAWETLFDRLDIKRPVPGASGILIVGGAGGVGSIAVQLARSPTGLTCRHRLAAGNGDWAKNLERQSRPGSFQAAVEEIAAAGLAAPGFVFATTHTDAHLAEIVKLIAPQGRLAVIDDPATLDILPFKRKSVSVHWEFMFTRSLFGTADVGEQGAVLEEVSRLVDAGTLQTTLTERFGAINAETLRRAHTLIESGRARGKIVLEGFSA